jgi:transcriptional regulator with XRE-family HTH domain
MRSFDHIAKLIKEKRMSHTKSYSQSELSQQLGYKNGQFISNVERGLCNVPLKMLSRISGILNISQQELKDAILADHNATIDNYFAVGDGKVGSSTTLVKGSFQAAPLNS